MTTATATLKSLARKVRLTARYGQAVLDYDKRGKWRQGAHDYRCTLYYQGRQYTFDFWQGQGITDDPDAKGVLECLLNDAGVSDDFEDFCQEFGYDSDSRRAEATWKACLKSAANTKRLLGGDFEKFLYSDR